MSSESICGISWDLSSSSTGQLNVMPNVPAPAPSHSYCSTVPSPTYSQAYAPAQSFSCTNTTHLESSAFRSEPQRPSSTQLTLFLADGGIARVGQRAGLARTETGKVVFVPAEVLSDGSDYVSLLHVILAVC